MHILPAGLPNIEGTFSAAATSYNATGAFSSSSSQQGDWRNSEIRHSQRITFSARNSNAIYGDSDTIQAPAILLISQFKI